MSGYTGSLVVLEEKEYRASEQRIESEDCEEAIHLAIVVTRILS